MSCEYPCTLKKAANHRGVLEDGVSQLVRG